MKVKMIVDGGAMQVGPAVAQQLGPMGINLGKVTSDVNEATKEFKGVKVPVELDVDSKTKTYTIQVFSPPVAELIKKELGLDKGSGAPLTAKVGNISVESIIGIAKMKQSDLLCRDLKSSVKTVIGSCVSLGVLVENKDAKDAENDVDAGVFDDLIRKEVSVPSPEKKKQLQEFFEAVKARQELSKKAAEAAAAAAEAAKAAATPAATPGAPAPAAAAKPEAKKK